MKKLLILGAGTYQLPLIKKAAEMGIYTIVAGSPGNYPGLEFAHKVYEIDFTNYKKITQIAIDEKIDGIISTGIDSAALTVGYVCDACGLTGLSYKSALTVTDKLPMKKAFIKGDVRTPRFRQIDFDEIPSLPEKRQEFFQNELSEMELPLIFKAVDNSGSRGIIRVSEPAGFDNAYQEVLANTKSPYFLIEEYITGEEYGVESFIQNERIVFILPNGKYTFSGDTEVPVGHFAPLDLPEETLEEINRQLTLAVKATGLNNTAINMDIIIRNSQVYVIEIAGRAGATCLPELVSVHCGFNYYEKLILAALGEPVDFTKHSSAAGAAIVLMPEKDGLLTKQEFTGQPDDHINIIHFDYKPGQQVYKFKNGSHRIGHVIVSGDTVLQADELLKDVISNIQITID